MGMFDNLTGNQSQQENKPKPKHKRDRNRQSHREHAEQQAQKSLKPEDVSDRVWKLAQYWLDVGEETFGGKRPPVNKAAFSTRLSDKINHDRTLVGWLKKESEFWEKFKPRWSDRAEFVNDVVATAIDLFFTYLTEEQKNSSALQFVFLEDEWDEWIYQAITTLQVEWAKDHATWSKPQRYTGVFDPESVGKPRAEDPCTDPDFAGMTWGEVWAQHEQDIQSLPQMSDEEYETRNREWVAKEKARDHALASAWSAKVANRTSNHHEETADDA